MGNKQSNKLPEATVQRLSNATKFTEKEVEQWYESFMSDCPRGKFTIAHYQKICEGFFPRGNAENYAKFVFNSLDLGEDATLDFENFLRHMSILSRGSVEDKQRWAFHLRDINHDGTITKNELRLLDDAIFTMIADHVPLPEDEDTSAKRTEKLYDLVQTDEYGGITLDAFIEGTGKDKDVVSALGLNDTVM